jgi:choline-sulfatase
MKKLNVILIVIDSLRSDHLKSNGYFRDTSPNIDKIAEEGISFLNSYTVLPRSDPAIVSMLTGFYPHTHGVRLVHNEKIKNSITNLAEILSGHGYRTAFIKPGSIIPKGYDSGFTDFDLMRWKIRSKIKRSVYKVLHPNNFLGGAEQRFSAAISWINKNIGKKFFFVIHTNDIHWPYLLPQPYEHMFDPNYSGPHNFRSQENRGNIIFAKRKLSREEIEHAIAHYDGGISYVDEQVGKLTGFLKKKSIYDETLIIITSDHGEPLGEHDYYFQHGASLYEQSVKSPLIFSNPGSMYTSRKIQARVQITDIMPTVLDFLDIPLVDKIEGMNLLPLIEGKSDKGKDFIFAESIDEHFKQHARAYFKGVRGKWRMMIVDDWKIIYIPHPEKDIFELYNLKNDPDEKINLIDKEKDKAEEMKKRILDFLKDQSMEGDVKIEDLSLKSRKLLVKAGYLESE